MEFNNKSPIYIQIVDEIIDDIIKKKYVAGEKMISIRDLAVKYTINQNTAMKCLKELELLGIIENRRGIGYFLTEDSKKISSLKKEKVKTSIKNFIKDMSVAGFTKDEIIELIEKEYE
ncbi:GntR family transcriptional regulator [Oceanivirga miroungae]|uniref:HTH-type transcriptional repressor YtrA n=1 Tax=Oceanivirga miroungae TaxID=1130046 RepID=A0A6I8MAM0_9FUSO|nr:GntR family transcriptional regulator [Oceanivirga miroungae]VWL85223.1 HTH-type transcriptional repressor YtrA [Oceanivirga miroungae]